VLGLDVVSDEDGAGWLAFLRSLTARGLKGVKLVISDADRGLVHAIAATLPGPTRPSRLCSRSCRDVVCWGLPGGWCDRSGSRQESSLAGGADDALSARVSRSRVYVTTLSG
jgi:Transposase, Mutator family